MFQTLSFIFFICFLQGIDNFIVPDEVPSLLSLVYSNIPPIKKGTDSRLGWGYRLGDHADIQILVELGPQTNTRKLGNEGDKNNKRNTGNSLRNVLWAQNQLLKKQQQQISDTEGGKWLESWSAMVNERSPTASVEYPVEGVGEISAAMVIPPELEELYGPDMKSHKSTTEKPKSTTIKTVSTTDPKDALDNVDLE